jgi:hypothetical protein
MRTRTPALFVLCVALATAGCGGSNKTNSSARATIRATTTSSSTTSTTTAASATSTVAATDATGDSRCSDKSAATGDVDGDGKPDRVVHLYVNGSAVLRVCASSVGYQELPGVGQAQYLALADIDADHVDEIFYGATTAGTRSVQVGRVVKRTLTAVSTKNGQALVLTDGFPNGAPPSGPRLAYGCAVNDVTRTLIVVKISPDLKKVTTTNYELDGGRGLAGDPIEMPVSPPAGDPIAVANKLATQYAPAC